MMITWIMGGSPPYKIISLTLAFKSVYRPSTGKQKSLETFGWSW